MNTRIWQELAEFTPAENGALAGQLAEMARSFPWPETFLKRLTAGLATAVQTARARHSHAAVQVRVWVTRNALSQWPTHGCWSFFRLERFVDLGQPTVEIEVFVFPEL